MTRMSIQTIRTSIADRQQTAVAIARRYLQRIEQHNGELNALREVDADRALQQAEAIDRMLASDAPLPPLAGVPVAIKDNIVTTFGTTTCASRMLSGYRSPFNATVVERLEAAGAVIVGKANCDEFAMGSSCEHSAFGPTRNPWDAQRSPGGSSGGSAAAVAADLCAAALGSDTGGSIRQPAAMCGIVGLKPSYGRVSRYGLVAFGSSFDQVGPFATSVADAAAMLQVIAGGDPHDSTCADRHVPDYRKDLDTPITDLRLALPKQYLDDRNDASVLEAVRQAVAVYEQLGATIVDVDMPMTAYGIATYYIIAAAEASSNLARFDGIRFGKRASIDTGDDLFELYARSRSEGFGAEVQRRIMLGTYVLSAGYYDAYYGRALKVRRLIAQEYDRVFADCQAVIGPTSPFPAFPIGGKPDPLAMYLCDVYTTNTSIAGICGMSLPCGFAAADGRRLPIGLQLQCPAFEEARLLRIARMFEAATDWHTQTPVPDTAATA